MDGPRGRQSKAKQRQLDWSVPNFIREGQWICLRSPIQLRNCTFLIDSDTIVGESSALAKLNQWTALFHLVLIPSMIGHSELFSIYGHFWRTAKLWTIKPTFHNKFTRSPFVHFLNISIHSRVSSNEPEINPNPCWGFIPLSLSVYFHSMRMRLFWTGSMNIRPFKFWRELIGYLVDRSFSMPCIALLFLSLR